MTILLAIFSLNGWSKDQQVGNKLVYSVSTDGFVNVRKAASASAKIVGVLATNRKGAELLSSKGTWWKVRVDGVVGYVNSKYVKLSSTPVKISGLPTVYYVVVKTCNSMDEVNQFFYSCPDAFDGSPVYKHVESGRVVYKICTSCHPTFGTAQQACDMTNNLFGNGVASVWSTNGLAECVYLPDTPADEKAIPLTPKR